MDKFLLNEMANMRSLMGRMDRHLTKEQSDNYTFMTINEAVSQTGNLMQPKSYISVITDKDNKREEIRIEIVGILEDTAQKIKSTSPYATDPMIGFVKTGKGNSRAGVLKIRKYIPYGTTQNPNAPQATTGGTTPSPAAPKTGGLMGRLKPKAPVTEGLMNRLGGNKTASATGTAPAAPKTDSIRHWFDTFYKGIIDIIAQDPRYDRQDVAILSNTNFIYNKFRATVSSEDESYVEKTSDRIKDEITEAIRNGNWQTVLQSAINPINIEAIVYGWTPSSRNHNAIKSKISDYGLQQGDPDYPTLILGPEKWEKFFNRRVIDNPKHRYPMVHPNATKGKGREKGTKGHYDHFGNILNGFASYYGYDITDTEPIDPNDTTDYVNGDLPGLKNNLTGELNDAAKAERDAAIQAKAGNLSQAQQQALAQVKTDEGKARMFNAELLEYATRNGVRGITDVSNSTAPLDEYVRNVLHYSKHVVSAMQYGNPAIAEPIAFILAFAICCYTIGSNLLVSSSNSGMLRGNTLADAWKDKCDLVLSNIQNTVHNIKQGLMTKYGKYGGDEVTDQQTAPSPVPATSQASINENVFSRIDNLLKGF